MCIVRSVGSDWCIIESRESEFRDSRFSFRFLKHGKLSEQNKLLRWIVMGRIIRQKMHIVILVLFACMFLSSCRYSVPEEKRVDVISGIAVTVNDNYSSEYVETPYYISMDEIDELTDKDSYLHKAFEKYDDVKGYKVYLLDDNKVLVLTDVIFQKAEGYVVSDEVLEGTLMIPGLSFDADLVRITNRIGESNIYSFSAGL